MNYKSIYESSSIELLMDALDECAPCTEEIVTCGPHYMVCTQDARGRDMVITVWANSVLRVERICSCCAHTDVIWIHLGTQPDDVAKRVNKCLTNVRKDWIKFWTRTNPYAWRELSDFNMSSLSPEVDDEGEPLIYTAADLFRLHQLQACLECMGGTI